MASGYFIVRHRCEQFHHWSRGPKGGDFRVIFSFAIQWEGFLLTCSDDFNRTSQKTLLKPFSLHFHQASTYLNVIFVIIFGYQPWSAFISFQLFFNIWQFRKRWEKHIYQAASFPAYEDSGGIRKTKAQSDQFSIRKKRKKVQSFSCVQLFGTPWTVAYQAPPSWGFSRQEYWSGLPSTQWKKHCQLTQFSKFLIKDQEYFDLSIQIKNNLHFRGSANPNCIKPRALKTACATVIARHFRR